jgi:hypothetical protein
VAAEKHKKHETKAKPAKIGGENAAGAILSRISTLSNITNTATMKKRE